MGDVIVSSTTDSLDQVQQAAGSKQSDLTIEEPGDVQVDAETQVKPPPKPERAEPEEDKGSPKLQKRVDKLIAQKTAAEMRAAQLERELEAAKAKAVVEETPIVVEEKPVDDPEPKQEQFDTYEKWIKAQTRWEIRQEMRELAQKEAEQAAQQQFTDVVNGYNTRVAEFKTEHDDWDTVVGNPSNVIHPGVQNALLELENGPAIVYLIASDRKLMQSLMGMSEARAIAEVGRMAARLEKEPANEPEPQRKGPDRLPVSSAPEPIRPLSGHSTRSTVNLDQLDYAEYRKIRDRQDKERYRR